MNINTDKLKGKHVYLQKLTVAHKELLRPLAKDERIWEFTKGLLINDTYDKQFDEYFANAIDPNGRGIQQALVIYAADTNQIIGMTRLYEYVERDKRIAVGYTWYVPSVYGKVYNKECKLLLFQYAFEEMQLNRVELTVVNQNIRSQKAIEKVGGIREGVMRSHGYRNDGSPKDTVIYSIINIEWPDVKKKLQLMSYGI